MKKIDVVYNQLNQLFEKYPNGVTTDLLVDLLEMDRSNVSRYLNQLCQEGKVAKDEGRPVRFKIIGEASALLPNLKKEKAFHALIGSQTSLKSALEKAKAAMLYPPNGLHTIIVGETGVGKSLFAEMMFEYGVESHSISSTAPFVRFNCADYADNPQLLVSQIFGVKKGTYTGADRDREGLLKAADKGVLFLDEVHRLSPQGQEMLFTYIDKGYFTPLGDTDTQIKVSVQIIAATTENPESALLGTFTRRMPMMIELPNLISRGIKDRYQLLEMFLKQESKRLKKSIYIHHVALVSFLLYHCPNNIGQLKSDLQLSCAKAFLLYKSGERPIIRIESSELPQHVKKGYMAIKKHRGRIEKMIKNPQSLYKFFYEDSAEGREEHLEELDFYDQLEKQFEKFEDSGLTHETINELMSASIDSHFKKHADPSHGQSSKEFLEIVDESIIELSQQLLDEAGKRLEKTYSEKIVFGLALHLNSVIERIRKGQKVYHPRLNDIRIHEPDAFMLAMEFAKELDQTFSIATPLDEIGYLAMFIAYDEAKKAFDNSTKVGVVLVMHGRSTASSMLEVVNELLDASYGIAIDMPLSIEPSSLYPLVKEAVEKVNSGVGVILLVDMGSLVSFGDMISEETGIHVKTVDCVTTPMLLEVTRRAIAGRSTSEILEGIKNVYTSQLKEDYQRFGKRKVIITACLTGEGASEKLKLLLEKEFKDIEDIQVINLNIINRNEFYHLLSYYQSSYHLLAVVSTIDLPIDNVPFFSAIDIFNEEGLKKLKALVEVEDVYEKISSSLKQHLKCLNASEVIDEVRGFIEANERELKVKITQDVKIGMALHLCFLIDNKLQGFKSSRKMEDIHYRSEYPLEMHVTENSLKPLEDKFKVNFDEFDVKYLCEMFLSVEHQRGSA